MRPKLVHNPPDPWKSAAREWLEAPPAAGLKVYEEECGGILSDNNAPDIGFRYSVDPYRGCTHACAYCYARRDLGLGAEPDPCSQVVVRTNAPALLREEFCKRSWKKDTLVFSSGTDCYQPIEAGYGLTRACLAACLEFRNPVLIITKSLLVLRDRDLLAELAKRAEVHVCVSLACLDEAVQRRLEPGAPAPHRRLEAMEALAKAGLRVGIGVAPIIPDLNEKEVPELLRHAKDHGASFAIRSTLRRPTDVELSLVIGADGVVRIEVQGASDDACDEITAPLTALLGGEVRERPLRHPLAGMEVL